MTKSFRYLLIQLEALVVQSLTQKVKYIVIAAEELVYGNSLDDI